MFGLVAYRERDDTAAKREAVAGIVLRRVTVLRGGGVPAHLSAVRAAGSLKRAGVREAVFPPDYPFVGCFARRGIVRLSTAPLHCAAAAAIVRRRMAQRGMEPARSTVAFSAERLSPELCRAAETLAAEVRYILLALPREGEAFARRLRGRYGVAARLLSPGEPVSADLTVIFGEGTAAGETLLLNEALPVSYDSELPNELLAALWRAGALDAQRLRVLSVG